MPWAPPPSGATWPTRWSRNYETKDGRSARRFTCLQAGKYWPDAAAARSAGPSWPTDERFADHAVAHRQHATRRSPILTEVFAAAHRSTEWRERLEPLHRPVGVVQDTLEAAADPQTVANGYVQDCETADGTPFQLVAAPVQFDERAGPAQAGARVQRARRRTSSTELGLDWDTIVDLKVRGVVA